MAYPTQSSQIIQSGLDSGAHAKTLHQQVALSASQLVGRRIELNQVVPPANQSPVTEVDQKPGWELDIEDILSRERGEGGNEKNSSFLKKLGERLTKKFRNQEVSLE